MPPRRRTSGVTAKALAVALAFGAATLATSCTSDDGEAGAETDRNDPLVALADVGDADPSCQGEGEDGVLRVGGLLAQTGQFGALLGAPQVAGARLAVLDVNNAGGVLGQPMAFDQLDSGESPEQAAGQLEAHLGNRVDAILGASTSEISEEVLATVVESCTVMVSPSNTGPLFTTVDDDDLYFRTAATDILQGRVLADVAIADGVTSAAILARDDAYGDGLRAAITAPFEAQGGEVVVDRAYDPEARDFGEDAAVVIERNPQALFLVGFAESAQVLLELIEQGFSPNQKRMYFVEGNMSNALAEAMPALGMLAGGRGTIPGAQITPEFRIRLLSQDASLPAFTYGPEAYDAVVVLALAAQAAGTDRSDQVARQINAVTRDGTACTSYLQCRVMLEAGEDINYDGQSGPLDFARPGEPTAASFGVYPWTLANTIDHQAAEFHPVSL